MATVGELCEAVKSRPKLSEEKVGGEVVAVIFVRLPDGGYMPASVQEMCWPDVMAVTQQRGALPRGVKTCA